MVFKMKWKGFKDIQATMFIDLTKSEEDLKNNLHKDARRYLKKSYENELKFEESNEWEKFYPIYKKVAINGGIIPMSFEELKNKGTFLLIVRYKENIVGGLVINIEDGLPNMLINAIDNSYYNIYAGYFAYWNMILWSKQKGYPKLNLGGYQVNAKEKLDDINKFKDKWGGEVVQYHIYSKNPLYILGRKTIRNFGFIKSTRDKIKILKYLLGMRVKKYGYFNLFKRGFEKFAYCRNKVTIFYSNLNENIKLIHKIDVVFRKADDNDFNQLIKTKDFIFEDLLMKRLSSGNECFVFVKGDKILHYSWVNYKEMDITELNIKIPLNSNEFCIFDCYTFKESRGLNLYPAMLCKIKEYLNEKGFVKGFIYADLKNNVSIKGIEKAGFKKLKTLKFLKVFCFKKKPAETEIL